MATSRTNKVFALSLGHGLTTVVALVSGMVLSRVLSKTDLATYRQTMLAYDIALPLLSLGLASGIYYFLPTEKHRVRGVVVDGLLMMVGMGLLYAVFIALGGNHLLAKRFSNPAIVATLAFLVPLPIIMLPAKLLSSVMVVQNQVQKLTVYNVLTSLLLTTSIIAACLLCKTPEAMIIVRVGVSMVIGLIAIRLMLQVVPKDSWRPCWGNMKNMLAYSIPLVGASAAGAISLQLDKVIVSSMCTPEIFAVYSNGAIEIPLVGIITGSIMTVIQPDLRVMVASGNMTGALALFRQAAVKSAAIMFPVMMFLFVSAEPFILTMFSSKYSGSVLPFRLYLLILPMRIVTFGTFLMALGMSRTILYRAVVGLAANAILSIILVHTVGFTGAILATILSLYLVEGAWNFTSISHKVGCHWREVLPFRMLFQLMGVSILACIPVLVLVVWHPFLSPLAQLVVGGACFLAALVGLAWLCRVEALKDEIIRLWTRGTAHMRT